MQVFVGLRGSGEELNLKAQNIWSFTEPDLDAAIDKYCAKSGEEAASAPIPLLFISFPSAKVGQIAFLLISQLVGGRWNREKKLDDPLLLTTNPRYSCRIPRGSHDIQANLLAPLLRCAIGNGSKSGRKTGH